MKIHDNSLYTRYISLSIYQPYNMFGNHLNMFVIHKFLLQITPPLLRTKPTARNGRVPRDAPESPKIRSRNIEDTRTPWRQIDRAQSPSSADKLDTQFSMVLQTISESIVQNEMRLVEQDRRDAIKLQWQQVAVVVDRLLLLIFVSLTLGITLGLTMQGVVWGYEAQQRHHSTALLYYQRLE